METLFRVVGVLILSFISLCLVGSNTRGNPKINKFFSNIQGSYNRLNKNLEVLSFTAGLKALRQLYGWASILFFTLFLIISKFIGMDSGYVSFLVFVFVFMSWFSINWFIDHKNTIFKRLGNILDNKCGSIGFIPEIWQGHKDAGKGFWIALEKLQNVL